MAAATLPNKQRALKLPQIEKKQPIKQPVSDELENKILIAYFFHTGNTKEVAQQISEYTGGTLAEIQRTQEYGDLEKEAEAEILNRVHPEITVSIDNMAEYDTIFVGYPIWLAYHNLIQCIQA